MRDAAGEFDDLLTAADLTERVGDHLAVLTGDDLGQLTLPCVEQLAEVEQDLRALGQRRIPPRRERGGSRVDHRAGILHSGQRYLPRNGAGRRIRHRRRGVAAARVGLVVDPVGARVGSLSPSQFVYLLTKSVMVFSW